MERNAWRWVFVVLASLSLASAGCYSLVWQARFTTPRNLTEVNTDAPFLKCHIKDGGVYALTDWSVDKNRQVIAGRGIQYDALRKPLTTGPQEVKFDDVVLVETNKPETVSHVGRFVVMALVTTVSLGAQAALCATKGCFGSCPTFYVSDGTHPVIQAEGFSDSVARTLEDTDIDHMYTARPDGRELTLVMKNEAPETHAVRSLRVLAVPRPDGGRVFRAGAQFYPAPKIHAPVRCSAHEVDCVPLVQSFDLQEYRSETDARDLAKRESIELTFPPLTPSVSKGRRAGVVIGARNSLVNTFLLYQLMAYMGRSAADYFLQLERGGPDAVKAARGFGVAMGFIEVEVLHPRRGWVPAAAHYSEVGPIARDVQMILLPEDLPPGDVRVRLRMAQGNWKIDYVALAELDAPVAPAAIAPSLVLRGGEVDGESLAKLNDPERYLITYQGDAYTMKFALPEGQNELFLESRGYYYEWMRKEWLAAEDPKMVAEMILAPERALRRLAPLYKQLEPRMEQNFWQSRFGQ